jgi:hypothetical protein
MKFRLPATLLALAATLPLAGTASAQAPAAPAATGPKNMLRNGNMEAKPRILDNLLDGVDKTGKLKAGLISVRVLGASGALSERRMPSSVALEDMNRDGKTDIVVALPEGFIYVYFNIGEANAPAFGNAEILPLFFSTVSETENEFTGEVMYYDRRVPRIGLGNWGGAPNGPIDIVLGNLFGQLFLIKSSANTATNVAYNQPRNKAAAEIPTTKAEGRYWGNLFSPQIVDWDKDGKTDIVMGEGSYSANSVFLMHNPSSVVPPKFLEENRYFLVTGDGREQLVPAVVDYNGDGRLDVLVADREGVISVHLRPDNWKLGDTLPLTSLLTIAGKDRRGQPTTIGTGDYNKDGLFDIVLGDPSGQVFIAVNSGTPQEPKFEKIDALNGVDVWTDNISQAPNWDFDDGSSQGNALGYSKVVTNETDPNAQVPEGTQALYLANFTPLNKIVIPGPTPTMGEPGAGMRISQGVSLKHNAKYTIEFMCRANKVSNMRLWFDSRVVGKTPAKVTANARGAVADGQRRPEEHWRESKNMTPGPTWRKMTHTFTAKLKNKGLADHPGWGSTMRLTMDMNSQDSYVYIDDFKMFEELPQ